VTAADAPPAVRLHIVTGKGGTGKTTVAAALALALASGGQRILLCEVEGRQGIASLFDVAPLPYDARRVAVSRDSGEVYALAVDAESALLEYLDMFYRLARAGRALDRFGVMDFATTIAPGVRDVLLIGKVYESTRRKNGSKARYDAVVLDAPPTGRIGRFLNVNNEVAGVAKVGPIASHASSIMRLLTSPQTAVHLVTTLEEMPVQETLDAVDELRSIGLRTGSIIVNGARDPELDDAALAAALTSSLDRVKVERALTTAGLQVEQSAVDGLLEEARQHAERVELEREQRKRLDDAGMPILSLPYLVDGIDLGGLYELADHLCSSGVF
jgi:anion-transporting  ArsA/GET3 family ATPase